MYKPRTNRSQCIYVLILAVLILSACTSKETKRFEEIQEFYYADMWQEAFDSAQDFLIDYPNSKEDEKVKEILNNSRGELDLIKAKEMYDKDNYTEALVHLNSAFENIRTNCEADCLDRCIDLMESSIMRLYEEGRYESVIDQIEMLDSDYYESNLPEELAILKSQAESADVFQAVSVQDYSDYPGVLDFGAFSGFETETSNFDSNTFLYRDVAPWLLDVYIKELELRGFMEGNNASTWVSSIYKVNISLNGNILRLSIDYIANFPQYYEIELGMNYSQVTDIIGNPGKLVYDSDDKQIYRWGTNNIEKPHFEIIFFDGAVLEKVDTGGEGGQVVSPDPPSIGMTKEEVLNSTWGSPEDINRTTTAYGVREQWVYSDYRYVYFENGVVTAIQE